MFVELVGLRGGKVSRTVALSVAGDCRFPVVSDTYLTLVFTETPTDPAPRSTPVFIY